MTYFPIAILQKGSDSLALIQRPEDLPVGVSFVVVLTQVIGTEQFQAADHAVQRVLKIGV